MRLDPAAVVDIELTRPSLRLSGTAGRFLIERRDGDRRRAVATMRLSPRRWVRRSARVDESPHRVPQSTPMRRPDPPSQGPIDAVKRGPARGRPKADAEEKGRQLSFVRRLIEAGARRSQVKAACERLPAEGGIGVGHAYADRLYDEVRSTMRTEFERERPLLKAEHVARLQSHISRASQDREEVVGLDKKGNAVTRRRGPNWAGVAQLERLYGEVAGTREPVRVEVDVEDARLRAIAAVLGLMTPADRARALAEGADDVDGAVLDS